MSPIVILAIVASAVVRFAVSRASEASTSTSSSSSSTASRPWQGRSGGFLAVWIVVGLPWWVALFALLNGVFTGPAVVGVLVGGVVLFPWPLARLLSIPLGLASISVVLARLANWTWGVEPRSGSAVAGALASWRAERWMSGSSRWGRLLRWTGVARRGLALSRRQLTQAELIGPAACVATAIFARIDGDATNNGDMDAADMMMDAAGTFDPRVMPSVVRRMVADDQVRRRLARGGLESLATDVDASAPIAGDSPTVAFLAAAQRFLGQAGQGSVGSRIALAWAWLQAPRRREAWAWFVAQRRSRAAAVVVTTEVGADIGDGRQSDAAILDLEKDGASRLTAMAADCLDIGALRAALRWHAEILASSTVSLDDVVALTRLWQDGLPEAESHVRDRSRALGLTEGSVDVGSMGDTVRTALRGAVEGLDLSAADLAHAPSLLLDVVEEVRGERLDQLDIAVAALRSRTEQRQGLPAIFELQEWLGVRRLAGLVARCGRDGRYQAYEAFQWTVCEQAVWLWNDRREHRLGNAIFRWLLAEAEVLDDTRGIETQKANVRCGP